MRGGHDSAFAPFSRGVKISGGVHVVGSRGVKITFLPEIEACTSCSIDGTSSARQPKPAPAAVMTVRVVFVLRILYKLYHRR